MGDATVTDTYNSLVAEEKNAKFVTGFYEMGTFAKKKLSNNPYTRQLTDKERRSCAKEAKQYAGTSWEKILNLMAEP